MTWRMGRIRGIPIELHYSWFPIFGMLTYTLATRLFAAGEPVAPRHWGLAAATATLFFGCLLAHELAHCVVAQRLGIRILGIRFFLLGGMARMSAEPSRPGHEFCMAAAGPAASFALGLVAVGGAYLLADVSADAVSGAIYLGVANVALGAFNLLPAFPMDGGRMLRALLWAVWRDESRSTVAATGLARGLGLLLMAAGAGMGLASGAWNGLMLIVMGGFLVHTANISREQARWRHALAGRPVSGFMASVPTPLTADLSVADALTRWTGERGCRVLPVYDGTRLAGMLDLEQAAAVAAAEQPLVPVSRLMRPPRRADLVRAESGAWEALRKMASTGRRQLYVVKRGTLLGVLEMDALLGVIYRVGAR